MTNDKTSKLKKKHTENKGVHISSHELDNLPSKISDDTEPHSPKCISVCNVREELKNVIETMGPNTATSSDAENDDSTYSTTDQTFIRIPELSSRKKTVSINFNSIDGDSQLTEYNVSELIEYPAQTIDTSVQTSKREYLCPNVYNNNIPPHNFCPHYMGQNVYVPPHNIHQSNAQTDHYTKQTNLERISRFATWLGLNKSYKPECRHCTKNCDLYKINIEQTKNDESPPRRLVFDLMDNMPKAETKTIGTNTKQNAFNIYNPTNDVHVEVNKAGAPAKIKTHKKETVMERVDIYYFDHGNAEYYRTTDSPPVIKTEYLAERTDHYTKKLWAEFFGTFNIGVSFVISFILQLFRFILIAIFRPLTIGVVQLVSDYFFKPCLAVTFNGIVQPPMIFLYNFATSVRDVCAPIADSIGYFIREASVMCKAIRLVQVETAKSAKPCCANMRSTGKSCGTE